MTQFNSAAISSSDTQSSASSLRRSASANTAQPSGLIKRLKSYLSAFAFIAILCAFSSVAHAIQPSTSATTLTIAPGNSITTGTPVTLTATVEGDGGKGPAIMTQGTVLFCDANAATCQGSALLAAIQVTNPAGTATAHLTLGVGIYSIKAVFQGLSGFVPPSSSLPQTVTVTGNASYSSFPVIAETGTAGNYSLIGGVAAFGRTPPNGTISFLDTTNGNAVLGTPTLDLATLRFNFLGSTQPPTGTGQQPGAAVLADVNNDGRLDMILAVNETNTISVQLGLGDGTFQAPIFSAGTILNPSTIVVGDFNGDGNLDLAMGNLGDTTITVLLGNGDGTFQAPQTYPVGNGPVSIAVGDFNGDGNLDLAVLDTNDNNVTILFGQGDGTFLTEEDCSILPFVQGRSKAFVQRQSNQQTQCPPMTFAVGSGASQIATADLNGDGNADLVVTNGDDATVSVLLGAGDGTFQPQAVYAVNFGVGGVAIADFNGDGFPDLVVVYSEGNTASVLLGNGDGTFQPTVNYAIGNFSGQVVASDFNGDGKMDVAVSNVIDGTISLLLGNGDGTFQPQVIYPAGSRSSGMAAGDLNGDGLPDLIVANRGGSNDGEWFASIFLSAQTETATSTGVSVIGIGTHSVVMSYPGDTDRAASTSDPVSLTGIAQTTTTTTLSLSPSTIAAGNFVSLIANVVPAPTGATFGTMSFFRGSVLLATTSVDSSGFAAVDSSNFPPGVSSSITAVYSGNAAFTGSTSAPQTLTVNPRIITAITLAAAPNPSVVGTLVVITATISPVPIGSAPVVVRGRTAHAATQSPVPNANLSALAFFSGTTRLGFGQINQSGVATFSTSTLPVGSSNITATYGGSPGFAGSTSAILVVVVTPLPVSTTTTLNTIASPGTVGQPITFTAAVSPTPSGTPTGTVSFFNGGALVGTGTVNSSGIATFTTSSLAQGTISINAVFSGNALFLGSESAPQTVVINPDYAVTAPAAPQDLAHGGSVNFTIGVPPVGNSYDSVVTMSASGLPAGATAIFNPSTVTPGIAGATTVMTVSLAATAITVAKLPPGPLRNHPFAPFAFAVAGLCLCFGKRKQLGRSLLTVLAFTVVLGGSLAATGCGGGFGNPGAAAQTVVVTVTGTSGSVQHSTHVTLILK
jgi:hypothetical protein